MENIIQDCVITLGRVLLWTSISWGLSICLGYLCYRSRFMYHLLLPIINLFRHISPFCWLPVIIILWGIGEVSVGLVLLLSMLFNGILLSVEIYHNVPSSIIEEACLSGADNYGIARHILLPIAIPELLNLYRILWSVGWTAIIAAEMLGVSTGMGYRLLDFRYLLQYNEMMVYIAIIGAIGIATDYGLLSLRQRLK